MSEIRLYGIVGDWEDGNDAKSVIDQIKASGSDDLDIYISSYGGDLADGLAIYNALKRRSGKTTAYIDAVAASSATVIMLGADRVVMPENTMIMVHNPWNIAMGDHHDMAKSAEVLEKHRDSIVMVYKEKTGKTEDELRAMMDEETWMLASEALEAGFIDEVISAIPEEDMGRAMAQFDFNKFNQPPERLAKVAAMYRGNKDAPVAQKKGEDMPNKQPTPAPQASAPEVNVEKIKADAAREGREQAKAHLSAVTELCARVGLDKEAARIAKDTDTIEAAQAKVIDLVASRSETPEFSGASTVSVGADGRDKFKAAAVEAIQMRGAVKKHDSQNQFRHMSLLRLAEECVIQAGGNPARDRETLLKQAFNAQGYGSHTTSDFPEITRDAINKSVLRGYEQAPETWGDIAVQGTLSDFKQGYMVGLNVFDNLDKVSEGGEYKYGTISERGERIQLGTYGKLLKITREMIINDDLNALNRAPELMGRAAARMPGNLAYAVLTENPNLVDGNALFSAANSNTFSDALSYDGLDTLTQAIETQKFQDSDGNDVTLGITPRKLIVPPQLRVTAQQLMMSELVGADNQQNTFRGMYDVVVEHRLGAEAARWFLIADPAIYDTIMVAFLDGNAQPFVDEKEGWNTDSIEFKVRLDCAAAAMESKTMARGGDGS